MTSADKQTDSLYHSMRAKYGKGNARTNGYRSRGYFMWEQRLLFLALGDKKRLGTLLDIGCGSGLMVRPLAERGHRVIGLDFNAEACKFAHENGIPILRGDAYALPLQSESIDHAICCQFLNQQPHAQAPQLIGEATRVLSRGGRLILVWRNGRSLLHRLAHGIGRLADRMSGAPDFPQVFHSPETLRRLAKDAGLSVDFIGVSCPLLSRGWIGEKSLLAKLAGASFFMVLRKPKDIGTPAP